MSDWPIGEWVPYELKTKTDPQTNRILTKITNGEGNNKHEYFNKSSFTGDGRYVIFTSDRTGCWQVYAYDLQEERVRRLTAGKQGLGYPCIDLLRPPCYPSVDPLRPLVYYAEGVAIHRVNMDTLVDDVIYTHPSSDLNMFRLQDISSDGQYLSFIEIGRYKGDEEAVDQWARRYEARPLTCIWMMTSDGAKVWRAHQEWRYLYHVNLRPSDPTTLLFCHEGRGKLTHQRMWLMRWDGSDLRPLRPQLRPDLGIVHEYWLADGHHVGYIYSSQDGTRSMCLINVTSGRERVLAHYPFRGMVSDRSGRYIVGDERELVTLFDVETGVFTPLAAHGQEARMQYKHCHPYPVFSPDSRKVLFCMNDDGANDLCLVDIGDCTT